MNTWKKSTITEIEFDEDKTIDSETNGKGINCLFINYQILGPTSIDAGKKISKSRVRYFTRRRASASRASVAGFIASRR